MVRAMKICTSSQAVVSGQWSVNAKPPWEGEAPAEPNLREYTVTELVLGGPRRLQASR
jgi:hypothetical protein